MQKDAPFVDFDQATKEKPDLLGAGIARALEQEDNDGAELLKYVIIKPKD